VRAKYGCMLGGALVLACGGLLGLGWLASGFAGESRKLQDFSSPQQARDFLTAHLPAPLPSDARIEELTYERFTDWSLSASVRFPSNQAALDYIERVKQERRLDDDYCGNAEPASGARYALPELKACGAVRSESSSRVLDFTCQTR